MRRILLIDNDKTFNRALSQFLQAHGLQVDLIDPNTPPQLSEHLEDALILGNAQQLQQLLNGKQPHLSQRLSSLTRRNRHLQQLNAASQKLVATLDTEEVMTQMLTAATNLVGAKDASVWSWADGSRQQLVCRATSNAEVRDSLQQYRIGLGEGVAGWVVAQGESAIINDTQHDRRFSADVDHNTGFVTRSVLAVPLQKGGETLGVLEILNKKGNVFDRDDVILAETLATSAAIALENASLVEKLRSQTLELQARNEDLDAFAHTTAHDLKTPLIWISGYSELLVEDRERLSSAEIHEYAQAIAKGAHKMERIVDELLLLANLRDASTIIQPIFMQTVVQEALRQLEHIIEEYKATITIPETFPRVVGYAPWLEVVWVNYISNALKYGGCPPTIEIGYSQYDNDVCFWVRDNGAGIAPQQQAQLFAPFSRLGQGGGGHGLGLSIVRRIIEKLGGTVSVESKLGKGSQFNFTLPKRFQIDGM